MSYEELFTGITQLFIATGLISLVVSVLIEFVIKPIVTLHTKGINILATILSIVLTFVVLVTMFDINSYNPKWYGWVAVGILGCLVAGITMNGYDKVYSYVYEWIRKLFRKDK